MCRILHASGAVAALTLLPLFVPLQDVEAQGRGNRDRAVAASHSIGGVTLTVEMRGQIQEYYSTRTASGAEALPPGIRRNLERGKPLPPGIAKKTSPPELVSRVALRDGYELVEVGLDVLLVEIATNVVHDVLMDVIR